MYLDTSTYFKHLRKSIQVLIISYLNANTNTSKNYSNISQIIVFLLLINYQVFRLINKYLPSCSVA